MWLCSLFRKNCDAASVGSETLNLPIRTLLVRFGGISGEFGRAMDRILARRSFVKIPLATPNEPDMLPKRTKKGAIRYLPYPNSS